MCRQGVSTRTPLLGEVRPASSGHHSLPTLQSLDDSAAFATFREVRGARCTDLARWPIGATAV